ncbi:MAG: ketoacyl-ACP synthase III [Butyrivibrio sp.]|nr:ketoacyl-ACP synthase III [Butyrivibrio sp.]
MKGLKIIATGRSLPSKSVTNDDLSKIVETSDEWIYTRTGIRSRYFCDEGENSLTLSISAAKKALESSGINKDDLGCIIVATLSATYVTPSTACLIQRELELPENIPALDINAACSGFIYGLEVARGLLSGSNAKYGLVIGVEQLSRILDMEDRSTCVLFGDGAGAAIVETEENTLYESVLGTKGGHEISCPGVNNFDDGQKSYVSMDGTAVFRFATSAIPKCIDMLQQKHPFSLDEVDHVVCHQANSRIIDHVVKKLKADPAKFYKDMDHLGNTSAASIPLALSEMDDAGMIKDGDTLLLVGFGSGLTWAGVLIKFQKAKKVS